MKSLKKTMIKNKKLILSLVIIASLTGLLTASLLQSQPTLSPFPPIVTQATQTTKQPTIANLETEMMLISPSALENLTEVYAQGQFNESFFDLSQPTGVINIATYTSVLMVHTSEEGLNSSAPHNMGAGIMGMFGSMLSTPYLTPYLFWNESGGYVSVMIYGSGTSAVQNCNSALEQLFNELQSKLLATWDISIQKVYNLTMVSSPEQTVGLLIFNSLNSSAEVSGVLESLIPDSTFAKNMAQKDSLSKLIQVGDLALNNSGVWEFDGAAIVGAVIEGLIGKSGASYTFSTRNLLQPTGNITSQAPMAFIGILLPTTSNITDYYPSTGMFPAFISVVNMLPSVTLSFMGPLNVEDVNVTYSLGNGVPYVVAEYDMTDWNMDPGETANLTLTLKNVGTATAYNVVPHMYIMDDNVMYFTDTGTGESPPKGPFDLSPGASVVIDYNVTANLIGATVVSLQYMYYRQLFGIMSYSFSTSFQVHVGLDWPLVVFSTDCSDWVVSPGETVSIYLTARNVGTQPVSNVTSPIIPVFGPVIDSNVTLPETGQPWMLGDISAGGSITANVTSEVDFVTFHIGGIITQTMVIGPVPMMVSIYLPLTLPGVRPSTAAHLEFEKYPGQISFSVDEEFTVSVKVKNLGSDTEFVNITDWVPSEYFEVSEGNTNLAIYLDSNCSATLVYKLKATSAGTIKLPPPTILLNYSLAYYTNNIIGSPLTKCANNTAYVTSSDYLLNIVEEANIELIGSLTPPVQIDTAGDPTPPSVPTTFQPIDYVHVTANASLTDVTLVFHYQEGAVPPADESLLVIYRWNGTAWESLPCTVDTVENTVTAQLSTLSHYALGLPTEELPPTVNITYPPDGGMLDTGSFDVAWSSDDTDIAYYLVTIDSESPVNVGLATSHPVSLGDGAHTVNVTAVDLAGLSGWDVVFFTVDATPPVVTITAPSPDEVFNTSSVTVNWTVTETNIDYFMYRLDEGDWIDVGLAVSHTFTGLSNGSHTVEIRAFDKAGHSDTDSISFTVNLPPTPPLGLLPLLLISLSLMQQQGIPLTYIAIGVAAIVAIAAVGVGVWLRRR